MAEKIKCSNCGFWNKVEVLKNGGVCKYCGQPLDS